MTKLIMPRYGSDNVLTKKDLTLEDKLVKCALLSLMDKTFEEYLSAYGISLDEIKK